MKHVKLLGLYIDTTLNFGPHITLLCKSLAKSMYAMRQLKLNLAEQYIISVLLEQCF